MQPHSTSLTRRGFTLVEITVVVAIIGILCALAIPQYGASVESTRAAVSLNVLDTLNTGVHRFNEVNYELLYDPDDSTADDEMTVLRTLQYRNPNNPAVGSPYVRNNWNPTTSGSTSDYRLAWSGSLFKLLSPGQTGYGIKVAFDSSDLTQPYVFPPGYTMAGQ